MAAMNTLEVTTEPQAADAKRFAERVQLSDEKPPFPGWQPSPRQIAAWTALIRRENLARKRSGEQDD